MMNPVFKIIMQALILVLFISAAGCGPIVHRSSWEPNPTSVFENKNNVGKIIPIRYGDWTRWQAVKTGDTVYDARHECHARAYDDVAWCVSHADITMIRDIAYRAPATILKCNIVAPRIGLCGNAARETPPSQGAKTVINISYRAWSEGELTFSDNPYTNSTEICRLVQGKTFCLPFNETKALSREKQARINCNERNVAGEYACTGNEPATFQEIISGVHLLDYGKFQTFPEIRVEFHESDECRIVAHNLEPFCVSKREKGKKSSSTRYEFSRVDEPQNKYGGIYIGRRLIVR